MPTGLNKSREELPWLYYPRSNSVRVINSHLDGGGGGFSPADVAGLTLWLDATTSSSVLNTVGPDVAATDGQAVRRWNDLSGAGNHANQTDGTLQPLLDIDGLNSLRTLKFDNSNDFLSWSRPSTGNATIFVVMESADTVYTLFTELADGSAYILRAQQGNLTTTLDQNSGTITYRLNGVDQSWADRNAAYTAISSAGACVLTIKGVSLASYPNGVQTGNPAGALQPQMSLSSVLFYDSHLSGTNIDSVEAYLATRYGITL